MAAAMVPTRRRCLRSFAKSSKRPSLSITRTASRFRRQRLAATLPTRCKTSHNRAVHRTRANTGARRSGRHVGRQPQRNQSCLEGSQERFTTNL
jgi:hypothetical protein